MQTMTQLIAKIRPLDAEAMRQGAIKLDGLLKPVGSLGRLEELAVQLAGIRGSARLCFDRKQILVMAADHGVYAEGVATSPREVTAIQALNMVKGTTGVCVLAQCVGAEVTLVDVGIDSPTALPGVLDLRMARGSNNIAHEAAMTREQAVMVIERCAQLAQQRIGAGVNLLGVGELGIANTTPAAAVISVLCDAQPSQVVGLGANYPRARLPHKIAVVERAIAHNQPDARDGVDVLAKVGGFDIGGMVGTMLGAAASGVPVVLDGFLSYSAALIACRIAPQVRHYLIPSHFSAEQGSELALAQLGLRPYLDLEMRLGEGSGAALAMGLIDAACAMYHQMGRLVDSDIQLPPT